MVQQDVKKALSMIDHRIDAILFKIDKGPTEEVRTSESASASNTREAQTVKDLGTYGIPKWALIYIVNGDVDGLSDAAQTLADNFLDKHFSDGIIPDIVSDSDRELNLSPAFGTRNESALVHRGESPYQAVDTVSVKFSQAGYFEARSSSPSDQEDSMQVVVDNTKEEVAAKMPPKEEEERECRFHR